MKTYNVELEIEAENEEQVGNRLQAFQNLQDGAENGEELDAQLQAFQDMQEHMEHDDLVQAVDVVVENPDIIDFIKEVAPEDGKELSLPDYVGIARKAWSRWG